MYWVAEGFPPVLKLEVLRVRACLAGSRNAVSSWFPVPNYFQRLPCPFDLLPIISFPLKSLPTLERMSETKLRWVGGVDVNIAGSGWQLTIEGQQKEVLSWVSEAGGGPPLVTGKPLLGHSLDSSGLQRPKTTAERPCKGSEKPSRALQGECQCPGSPSDRACDQMIIRL